jgi:TonB family protein
MKFWKFACLAALLSLTLAATLMAADAKLVHLKSLPESKITSHPQPEYPADAIALKVHGAVKVSVIIGENGRVMDAKSVSGPALLGPAAAQAVRNWTFEPTTVDEHAVRVVTTVTVMFELDRDGRPRR